MDRKMESIPVMANHSFTLLCLTKISDLLAFGKCPHVDKVTTTLSIAICVHRHSIGGKYCPAAPMSV